MAWNFSGLTIISFNLNHSTAAWLSVSSVEIRFSMVLSAALIMLSSAKFNSYVFVIQRYRSFINILERSGPSIKAWRTLDKSTWNTLSIVNSYILIPPFLVRVKKSNSVYKKSSISIHFSYKKIMSMESKAPIFSQAN